MERRCVSLYTRSFFLTGWLDSGAGSAGATTPDSAGSLLDRRRGQGARAHVPSTARSAQIPVHTERVT